MSDHDQAIIICRCEDLSLAQIRRAMAYGAQTIDEIKRLTRCGMGACQGRTCRPLVAAELARALNQPLWRVVMPRFRPPSKPVLLGSLARAEQEDREDDHD
ncbi:MAG: (2Fe-2S)-binding protein [Bacillota bacterium]